MFSRQNMPDKGLICKILGNKELARTIVGVSSVLGIPFRKYDLISKRISANRSSGLVRWRAVAPLSSFTKLSRVVCDVGHSVFVTLIFPFRKHGSRGEGLWETVGSVPSVPVYRPRFIPREVAHTLFCFGVDVTKTWRVILPGGDVAHPPEHGWPFATSRLVMCLPCIPDEASKR
jgi:hypothetical protein